jgi:hypothetical protein
MNTTDMALRKPFPHKSHSYLAGLVFFGCLIPIPIVATIFTASIYIAPISIWLQSLISSWISLNWLVIIAGFVITLVFWLLCALFSQNFTSIESANPVSASHLKNHFSALHAGFAALQALNDNGKSLPKERVYSYRIAYEQVKAYLEEIERILERKDTRWIAGTGYLRVWNLVHRAEEAMITLEPREEVIREAIYDEMRLTGSSITGRDSALNKLELAVEHLSASATQYLNHTENEDIQNSTSNLNGPNNTNLSERLLVAAKILEDPRTDKMDITKDEKNRTTGGTSIVTTQDPNVATTNGTLKVANENPSDASGSANPIDKPDVLVNDERNTTHVIAEVEARNALRDARRVINEYRDHLWEGLVTSRNLLMGTAIITGLLTYVLFCFAIIAGATPAMITAATAFYLVGALIGLFGRLYDESKVDNATDDYNLTLARIIVTPVLSGIAGVLGVLLTTMLSLTLLKSALPQNVVLAVPQLGLDDTFNLQRNSLGILIAAAFALTPNLLINTLKKKANDFTDKLQNTGASDQATSGVQSKSGNKQ